MEGRLSVDSRLSASIELCEIPGGPWKPDICNWVVLNPNDKNALAVVLSLLRDRTPKRERCHAEPAPKAAREVSRVGEAAAGRDFDDGDLPQARIGQQLLGELQSHP